MAYFEAVKVYSLTQFKAHVNIALCAIMILITVQKQVFLSVTANSDADKQIHHIWLKRTFVDKYSMVVFSLSNVLSFYTFATAYSLCILYFIDHKSCKFLSDFIYFVYTVSQKNDSDVAHYNFNAH